MNIDETDTFLIQINVAKSNLIGLWYDFNRRRENVVHHPEQELCYAKLFITFINGSSWHCDRMTQQTASQHALCYQDKPRARQERKLSYNEKKIETRNERERNLKCIQLWLDWINWNTLTWNYYFHRNHKLVDKKELVTRGSRDSRV